MRFFKGLILTFLLITTPTLLASPHEHFHMLTLHAKLHKNFKKKARYHLIPYDHILKILDEVESGKAKKIYTKKQLKRINKFVVHLAQEGTSYQHTAALNEDIQTLLNGEEQLGTCDILWPYFYPFPYYEIFPFLKVNWKSTKKFVKKYKKEIIIGSVVVIAVATVIIATHGAGTQVLTTCLEAGTGVAGAADDTVPKIKEVELAPEQREQALQVKEYICENITFDEIDNKSIGETAREVGSRIAHEVFDGISELGSVIPQAAQEIKNLGSRVLSEDMVPTSETRPIKDPLEVYEDTVAKGHGLIDQVFSTNYANEYTAEAKVNDPMNNFIIGIIPLPGMIYKNGSINVKEFSKLGRVSDRAGYTKAGRGSMKHGYREGRTIFEKPVGNPTQINDHGQRVLDKILNHPEKKLVQYTHKIYGPVIEIEAPEIGGVRFTGDGQEMMGFMEPKWIKK